MILILNATDLICNADYMANYTFGYTRDSFKSYLEYMVECMAECGVESFKFIDYFTAIIEGKNLKSLDFFRDLFKD